MPKGMNPVNVSKARPIEDFWDNLKQKVYKGDWSTTMIDQLKNRIKSCLKKIDKCFVQRHIGDIRQKLGAIGRNGL